MMHQIATAASVTVAVVAPRSRPLNVANNKNGTTIIPSGCPSMNVTYPTKPVSAARASTCAIAAREKDIRSVGSVQLSNKGTTVNKPKVTARYQAVQLSQKGTP